MDRQTEQGQPLETEKIFSLGKTQRSTAITENGRPLQAEKNFRTAFCERSTVDDGTVDRQSQNGRLPKSTGRPLRLQEVAKTDATRILRGLSWKPRVLWLEDYKYTTLGHFYKRGEPPLERSLKEKGSTSLVSRNLWDPFLEVKPAELKPWDVLREVQEAVFIELLLRGS